MIAIAGWRVWGQSRNNPPMKLWWAQLVLNFVWSPIFFLSHRIEIALGVIVLLLITIIGFMVLTWRQDKIASLLFIPYAAWVAFASRQIDPSSVPSVPMKAVEANLNQQLAPSWHVKFHAEKPISDMPDGERPNPRQTPFAGPQRMHGPPVDVLVSLYARLLAGNIEIPLRNQIRRRVFLSWRLLARKA